MEQLQFPELVDIETVAKLLGVGERFVRRMVTERRVPTVKIGHYVRFDLADIRKWVDEQTRPSAQRPSVAHVGPDRPNPRNRDMPHVRSKG
jgi:excisionase family DNA binding protein